MTNLIALNPRRAGIAAGGLMLALCVSAAPVALADTGPAPTPEGANYLLSYGSHNFQADVTASSGVGSYASAMDTPEPATWGMFGLGLAMIGMGAVARRRRARTPSF